ncbi:LuxR C-terminal-related transcriptional regulator [Nocardiopsis rhodophaea]
MRVSRYDLGLWGIMRNREALAVQPQEPGPQGHVRPEEPENIAEAVPDRVRAEVRALLDELSEQARQLVRAASLLGPTFTLHEVALIQSVTTMSLLPALDEAVTASLIRFREDRLAFRSPQVQRSVREGIPAEVRRILGSGMPSPDPGDPVADPTTAVVSHAEAEEDVQHMMASLFLAQGALSRPLAPRALAMLRAALAGVLATCGSETAADHIAGLFRAGEQVQKAKASGILAENRSGPAAAVAAVVLSNLAWAAGHLDEALHQGREARRLSEGPFPAAWRPYPALALALKSVRLGELAEGRAELARIRAQAQSLGHPRAIADSAILTGRLLISAGKTAEAEAELASGVALAHRIDAGHTAAQGESLLALTSLRRGEVEKAVSHVWRGRIEHASERTAFPSVHQEWVDFRVALGRLDPYAAIDLLAAHHADLSTSPLLFVGDHSAAASLVQLARAAGEFALASTVVRAAERLAARNPAHPILATVAAHARGVLHDDRHALERAAQDHRSRWASASAREDLGMLLSRQGPELASARRRLRSAAEHYADIGATADVARVQARLRTLDSGALKARTGRPATPPRSAPALLSARPLPLPRAPHTREVEADRLTEAELRVALLVAEGKTNRQVARLISRSPHTVNYHLRQIFRKLDLSSRVELARHFRGRCA